jgi:hypothetical protein
VKIQFEITKCEDLAVGDIVYLFNQWYTITKMLTIDDEIYLTFDDDPSIKKFFSSEVISRQIKTDNMLWVLDKDKKQCQN